MKPYAIWAQVKSKHIFSDKSVGDIVIHMKKMTYS